MGTFPFLYLVLLLMSLIKGEFAQSMDCNASEREALLDLRLGLEDSNNLLSSWHKISNCCQWWGVHCDNTTGAVTSVDLHSSDWYEGQSLAGEIRPSLTKLKSLKYLDLSCNRFNGTIPVFLSSLENLQYLNLSNAGFGGPIPPNLGNLSRLQVLVVSNGVYDFTVYNFEWVTGLVSLRYLDMSGSDLSKVGSEWVTRLNKLPYLTELYLSFCSLSSFTSELSFVNFTSLAVLDLSFNQLHSILPSWMVNISSLVSVDIRSSGLYGRIPLGFGELPNLQSLELFMNDLRASCYQLFRGSWEKIEVLDFNSNKLHGRLPSSLGNMSYLAYLDLSFNGVQGGLPSSIGKLCNLQYVDLSLNNLTGSFPEILQGTENCPSKIPFPNLHYLIASDNRLVGHLPDWLGKLKNLVTLNLQWNSFQGPIPSSFGNLQNLPELQLQANKLNGTLPDSLGQLSKLTVLNVSMNELTGVISEVHFSRLSKLESLDLSENSLIFNVSSNWIPPFQLTGLDLGSCHLGPSFPTWLRFQKQLEYVHLPNASISDSVPDWFWKMSGNLFTLNISFNHLEGQLPNLFNTNLEFIDLSSNLFSGPIPLLSANIQMLDLSSNRFSGSIPSNISKIMPFLYFFSLSNNQMTGEVPHSIGEMIFLEVIDLSGNHFIGSIPSSIGDCSVLAALDLQNNNLSGKIPSSLGQLNWLETLHLSGNRFSGEIPSTLQNLSSLETLDLGNNNFAGNIPPWIGDGFPRLRILSLRSNDFFGKIPSSFSNLSSLQVLDLADNALNGKIPASFGNLKAMAQRRLVNTYLLYGEGYRWKYYQESFVVNIYGRSLRYTKTLSLLTSIDLSRNSLSGELPKEITQLAGLVVLNLSRNHVSGKIPESISELHQLLSLDLSDNSLSGAIPASVSSMTFLAYLNVSNNNLSGTIPCTNQMETFDASSFAGNPGLSGAPLAMKCSHEDPKTSDSDGGRIVDSDNGDSLVDKWFYLSVGLGYAAGLLVPFLIFAIRRSWGGIYFAVVDRVVEGLIIAKGRAIRRRTHGRH